MVTAQIDFCDTRQNKILMKKDNAHFMYQPQRRGVHSFGVHTNSLCIICTSHYTLVTDNFTTCNITYLFNGIFNL